MTTLFDDPLRGVLDRLHRAAENDDNLTVAPLADDASSQQRADAMAEAYLPVSPEGGRLLYALTRAARPQTVVEFGTSYGISTLYLAAAVRDNGLGHVVTTEMSTIKIEAARTNVADAGVDDLVTVLAGDALETLAGVDGPIGLLLLDGWKGLYLPVLRLLQDRLAPGALVIGDDSSFETVRPYVDFVRDPANGYVSVGFPVEDGMEVSSWVGLPDGGPTGL